MEVLQIENLTFCYPGMESPAISDISLSIEEGEFAALCGVSGCGKSTLLKMLKREISPYGKKSGKILFENRPQEELSEREACANIGFIAQKPESQIVTDKVWHELAFGLESLGIPQQIIRRRVAEMAAYFGIESWFRKSTFELSGGEKQLLNLASVMVMQPKILILDEPTAQLDPIAAADFISTLKKLNSEFGLTVLMAEHRLEDVLPIADRVILLDGGRIAFSGNPENFSNYFDSVPEHPMAQSLPAAAKIYRLTGGMGKCPLTVREGRKYISDNFGNSVKKIDVITNELKTQTAAELKNISFRYDKELPDVLRDISLKIYKAEHLCILGANGAGKTTLLNIFAGLFKPYCGKAELFKRKMSAYSKTELYRNNIALLPQDPQTVFLKKTVKEDLYEMISVMKYDKNTAEEIILNISKKTGITQLLDKHPYDLSGGEQQKAALAKVLLLQPKILLLDEPTKGMDAYYKRQLSHMLKALLKEGMTIITVTHDIEFAAANADRCAFIFDGQIISCDTPNAFFSGNTFYTTAANRISRGIYENAVLCEEVASLCKINSQKGGCKDE